MSGIRYVLILLLVFLYGSREEAEDQAQEELQNFFQDYQKWEREKRAAGQPETNSSISMNWGYKKEEAVYFVSEERVDFFTGFIKCKQLGMDPVTIMTRKEQMVLEAFLKPQYNPDAGKD